MYACVCMHACIHVCACMNGYLAACTCMRSYICVRMHACMYVHFAIPPPPNIEVGPADFAPPPPPYIEKLPTPMWMDAEMRDVQVCVSDVRLVDSFY